MQTIASEKTEYQVPIFDLEQFLSYYEEKNGFYYVGSMTVPPCEENVHWVVYEDPLFISKFNLDILTSTIGVSNRAI